MCLQMTYEPMNEWMWHEFCIFLQICVSNVFEMHHISAWNTYTNYEWTNFTQFPLLNRDMLSLWCYVHHKKNENLLLPNKVIFQTLHTIHATHNALLKTPHKSLHQQDMFFVS
jgi:hypothetical protein